MPERKILIVEDEDVFADNLQLYLQCRGWDARVARSGRLGVAAASEFLPWVVLLDYRLPDMDGFAALAAIRASQPLCGCLLMTAHPPEAIHTGAEQHCIFRILQKPFSLAELEAGLLAAQAAGANGAAGMPARR